MKIFNRIKKIMLSAICMVTSFVSFAQVGIGTNNPQSILEIVSPNNGLILPRVANTAAVTTPINGMFIYDISTECVKTYENNRWTDCLEKNDAAPVASAVNINGAPVVGETLIGMYTYTDADADTQGTSIYKWYRADDATGTNQTIIAGVTNNSYTLTETDKTKYIAFEVTPVARTGTATTGLTVVSPYIGPVISYKDETTVIQDITLSVSGQIWMDRNLGATIAASTYYSTDPDTFGDLYQWGRRKDGHQDRNNTATSTVQATGSIANNGGAFFIDTSTANSNAFFGMSWTTFTGNNLWEDGVNDPCPTGYRVPTKLEWDAINPHNAWEITLPDYNEYEELNLPRNYGGFVGYWSSTKYENNPNHAYGFIANVQQVRFGNLIKAHSEALGVRCIKITTGAGPEVSALSISGNLVIGETVTATYTYTDINNDAEGASTFKWFRANDALGTLATLIPGATSSTYTLVGDDNSKHIAFEVRPIAATGTPITGAPVVSAFHGPVGTDFPPVASAVSVDGNMGIGATLSGLYTYSDTDGDIEGTSTFQWYRADDASGTNQTAISGATANTYTLVSADESKHIAFQVTPVATTGTSNVGSTVLSSYKGPVTIKDTETVVQDIILPTSGQTWMDRNLGATAAATVPDSTDPNTYGDLYQWGRHKDGHEDRTNASTTTVQATGSNANNGGVFIINDNNWTSFSGNNLWADGVNDPCPLGYRIPTKLELDVVFGDFSTSQEYRLLNIPLAGYRNFPDGDVKAVNVAGYLWSTETNGDDAPFFFVLEDSAGLLTGPRSYGFPVRCIKE